MRNIAGEKRKHPPIPVIIVVLALLIGGGTWWWWSSTHPATVNAQEQVSGSVEANEYQVAAALSGRITEVKVAEGDTVTKGQKLVQLDDLIRSWRSRDDGLTSHADTPRALDDP